MSKQRQRIANVRFTCQRGTLWYTIMDDMKNIAVKIKKEIIYGKDIVG
jgi:hypothetical protein